LEGSTDFSRIKEAARLHHRSINNVAEHLAMAKQLRAKTANYVLTDEEIGKAQVRR
jgi:hypothetical protein